MANPAVIPTVASVVLALIMLLTPRVLTSLSNDLPTARSASAAAFAETLSRAPYRFDCVLSDSLTDADGTDSAITLLIL